MIILGISAFFHDSAAALIDSELGILCAAEEERFTRKKHDNSFPSNAISFCLSFKGLSTSDIDFVAFYEEPWTKFNRVLGNSFRTLGRSELRFGELLGGWLERKLWVPEIVSRELGIAVNKVKCVPHHMSHAFAAYGPSGFGDAACMTLDGVGEYETGTFGYFKNGSYVKIASHEFPNSLGLLYSAFAEFLGFEVNEGEFKVMGMAAYGEPIYLDKIRRLVEVKKDFGLKMDMSFFIFDRSNKTNLSKKFLEYFGPPRTRESQFLKSDEDYLSFTNSKDSVIEAQQYYANVAASLQLFVEETILGYSRTLRKHTGLSKLVYAGGVALNSVANGRLVRESGFESVFIQPAAGDSGSAIGAALALISKVVCAERKRFEYKTSAMGKAYSELEIRKAISDSGVEEFIWFDQEAMLVDAVAERLSAGQVGAICRGGFEFGPRALGHRSIIADPRSAAMKARVNHAVKFRELFRPFAPIVAEERAQEYFDFDERTLHSQPFEYMLAVTRVKPSAQKKLEAITHVDGTARVQVVRSDKNAFLYELLMSFERKSGVAVLMNTSFNRRGEPIVNSPEEAIHAFLWTDIDFLIIEGGLLFKKVS